MNKIIVLFAALPLCIALFAEDAAANKKPIREKAGVVVKPGSQRGRIVFADAQNELNATNIARVAGYISLVTGLNVTTAKVRTTDVAELKKSLPANVVVVVTADDKTPPMLVAPEELWAVVNVRKMKEGLKSPAAVEKFFESRARKELLRAYSLVCGGGASTYPRNAMNVATIPELDMCVETLPMDRINAHRTCLQSVGVAPELRVPYGRACYEGWAPAPTNSVQKRIWERAHALPSDPIKIKYDPKRDK